MVRYVTPVASQAQPGMIVQRQNPYSSQFHVITEVNHWPDAEVQIVTNEGSWVFNSGEEVRFPRRPDNSKIDWTIDPHAEPPTVRDLAIGDILPSQTDPDPRKYDEHPNKLDLESFMLTRQVVTSIWMHPQYHSLWHIGLITPNNSITGRTQYRRIDVKPDEKLSFPWMPPLKNEQRSTEKHDNRRRYAAHGPYASTMYPNRLIMIADHPNGRGRWPKELDAEGLKIPINTFTDLYIVRPSSITSERGAGPYYWSDLKYLCSPEEVGAAQWGRSSSDAEWGKTSLDYNPAFPGARAIAMEAYLSYLDPEY